MDIIQVSCNSMDCPHTLPLHALQASMQFTDVSFRSAVFISYKPQYVFIHTYNNGKSF